MPPLISVPECLLPGGLKLYYFYSIARLLMFLYQLSMADLKKFLESNSSKNNILTVCVENIVLKINLI